MLSAVGFSEEEWVKWLMLVAMLGFVAIFSILAYAALRWIKYERPGDRYSPPLPSALENPQTELEDLTYVPSFVLTLLLTQYLREKYNKKRKLTNAFLLFRGKVSCSPRAVKFNPHSYHSPVMWIPQDPISPSGM